MYLTSSFSLGPAWPSLVRSFCLCACGVSFGLHPCKCHEQGASGAAPLPCPQDSGPYTGCLPEAVSTALPQHRVRESSKGQARTGPRGLTQTGTWAPTGAKEDGGSSSGLGCSRGGGFRPEAHGRGLLGSSADRVGPTGWTWCRPHPTGPGTLRGSGGASQAVPPEEREGRGQAPRPQDCSTCPCLLGVLQTPGAPAALQGLCQEAWASRCFRAR